MHPAIPAEGRQLGADGVIIKSLASFHPFNFEPILKKLGIEHPLIVLGSNTQFTIWSVIDVETSILRRCTLQPGGNPRRGFSGQIAPWNPVSQVGEYTPARTHRQNY